MSHSMRRIGIVGAGVAGLRCADVLMKHGFDVTILEARKRVGGRMHQTRLANGHLVDMGPNWIHGAKGNPLTSLAKATGTYTLELSDRISVFTDSGDALGIDEAADLVIIMWTMVDEIVRYSKENSDSISPEDSFYDYFAKKIPDYVPDSQEGFERRRKIVLQLVEIWSGIIGTHVRRQSLKYAWLEDVPEEGGNFIVAETYEKILKAIARPSVERSIVKFDTVVSKIQRETKPDGSIKLAAENGQTWEFDEVVVTTPLGWLKQNLKAFEPPLPSHLAQAVENLSYGSLEKVYISFPKAFWLTDDESKRVDRGWIQWACPTYDHKLNAAAWSQGGIEFGSSAGGVAQPTFLFYSNGEQSKWLTSEVSKLPSQAEKDALLYKFFKPYYSLLPNYDPASADCKPVACVSTDWLHDPFAGNGSYINFQVGVDKTDVHINSMREGLPAEGLWLAGEHTAPFAALGTVHGAYMSGERVAERIAKKHGRA